MTTEQTAQQLELAAQILRTGHPFEVRHDASDRWHASLGVNPAQAVLQDWHLRPVLATPPDNRPLHNPDSLTAEQVGVGYRLALPGESAASPHDFWDGNTWKKAKLLGPAIFAWCCRSCRLPISAPWPEPVDPYAELKAAHAAGKVIQYRATRGDWSDWPKDQNPDWLALNTLWRIKPEPAFQLPPCAPGMRWHREDGWKEGDLPQGYRPLVAGEARTSEDQLWDGKWFDVLTGDFSLNTREVHCKSRTTRPLTFEHAGKTWTWHRPGDPMPCDGEAEIEVTLRGGRDGGGLARVGHWNTLPDAPELEIIGWRYADEKKTVPLGPEDVRCGDEITIDEYDDVRRQVLAVESTHVHLSVYGRIDYETLRKRQAKIRRRDSDEFVPCSKEVAV